MAASKNPRARLMHIRDEIDGVAAVIRGLSFADYGDSYLHRRAVERAVQIVSEAAGALPPELIARYPDAPWKSIVGIGNVLRPNTSGLTTSACGRSPRSIYPRLDRSCSA
jgi:uncharacterized protein with HEPN domain